LFVLGSQPRKLDALDLRLCGMAMERRGEPVSFGAGRRVPRQSAQRGAVARADDGRRRQPLQSRRHHHERRAGPMVGASPGDVLDTRINGLGSRARRFRR
jgi:2-keto-4-pentenoate hydratase